MRQDLFSEEEKQFQQQVRMFVEREIMPNAEVWDHAKRYPRDMFEKLGI